MKMEKRLEKLGKAYFPNSKRRGYYLYELHFLCGFYEKYGDHEESAPPILLRAFREMQHRPSR
jgi:hypothetical protein